MVCLLGLMVGGLPLEGLTRVVQDTTGMTRQAGHDMHRFGSGCGFRFGPPLEHRVSYGLIRVQYGLITGLRTALDSVAHPCS